LERYSTKREYDPLNLEFYKGTGTEALNILSFKQTRKDEVLNFRAGLMDVCQHQKAETVLVTRDAEDQPLCHGGEKVVAEVWYRDASRR
jgi:hypothetical protein